MELTEQNSNQWSTPKNVFIVLALLAATAIIIVSILREKIVHFDDNQVSITGQGRVSYQPDTADVSVGVQIDKAPTSEQALSQLNEKMTALIAGVQALGIPRENIATKNYSLSPQYDYKDGTTRVSGYTANQQVAVKVEGIKENTDLVQKVVTAAGAAGSNQITGVNYYVADPNALKQQARVMAINDAKKKSDELARAAGVQLGKVIGWYENVIQSPDGPSQPYAMGMGGDGLGGRELAVPKAADIPSGTQDIIIEMSVNYQVR